MKKQLGSPNIAGAEAGGTNWEKLRGMRDDEIRFTADAPQTSAEEWASAVAHRGLPVPASKTQIALRVDSDVLDWFKSQGPKYQTKMNAVLRAYRDARLGPELAVDALRFETPRGGLLTRDGAILRVAR